MDDLIQNRNAKFTALQQEIDTLKETLSNQVKEKEYLSTTLNVFKIESKEKESKYIDKEIVLENQNKELENILSLGYQNPFHLKKAQRIKPTLYDGSVIAKEYDVISVNDDEETLILEEDSRSKMLDKQNDPILIKQKINISPIDYSKLNKIKEDFGKRFVTKNELSAEQAFWLKHSNYNRNISIKSHKPVRIEAPSELPKCSIDKNAFEIQIKQLSIDNDQLLKQIMSQEIVHIAVNYVDILNVNKSCVDECNKCLELETELLKKKDLIEKDVYDKLLKSYSTLEKHCISLELTTQLNQESQKKDTVIRKLKDMIKSLSGKDSVENVKKDIDEIETINIELEHSVTKLLSENENLRYNSRQPKLGLGIPKDLLLDFGSIPARLVFAGASLDKKSTTRVLLVILNTAEFLLLVILNTASEVELIVGNSKVNDARHNLLLLVFWATVKAKTVNGEVQLQALVDGKKIIITESIVRRDLQLEDY
ncbi:hypothetical protein Tco_0291716 [Tanacetum coccineum]